MIIIGEQINATRRRIASAIRARDAEAIGRAAAAQADAGADYLDLNGGDPSASAEVENVRWLAQVVQERTDVPLCIDSANPEAMAAGVELAERKPIVNSISLEDDRLKRCLPIVAERECSVVALCMADEGMPTGVDDRVARAGRLVEALTGAGKQPGEIIVDPCFVPVCTQPGTGADVCRAIRHIREEFPGVHVGGGLSNVSFGLPRRRLVNLAMAVAAVHAGMDAAIIDPCTPMMVPLVLAAEVVSGADEWCTSYVEAYREGALG